jgi:4-hydroxy-3-methylbut-2-enyl diphosphate reductase
VPEGSTVVLAAHGVTPEVRAEAELRCLTVVDATCPLVAKVHHEARRFAGRGYDIVLVGHSDHEEVVGTRGEAADSIHVIDDASDVATLDLRDPERVAYLTQTTLAIDETADIIGALRHRFPRIQGPRSDDICYATQNRQEAVRALSRQADVMLVVGSPNSSNTARLAEVAERAGCPAHVLEDGGELDPSWLIGCDTVGITAGASAPEVLVQGVVDAVGSLGPVEVTERSFEAEDVTFTLPPEVR